MHAITSPADWEERWQIATAMVTDPNIKTGTLYLWNPSVSLYDVKYTYKPGDLQNEINIIDSILYIYNDMKEQLNELPTDRKPMFTIDDIAKDYLEEQSQPEAALERMVV